jgi:uncharacterized repeat protein (TIGR01451 family)
MARHKDSVTTAVRIAATLAITVLVVTGASSQQPSSPVAYRTVALSDSQAFGPGLEAGATFFSLRAPVINNAGEVAFWGGLDGSTFGPPTIWKWNGSSLVLLAGTGTEGPGPAGLPEHTFSSFSVLSDREGLNLSDGGHVSLAALLAGPDIVTANRDVNVVGIGPLAVMAQSGVETELGPGVEAGTTFATIADLQAALNSAGDAVIISSLAGGAVTSANNRGIWTNRGGALSLIARKGTDDASGPGLGAGIVFTEPFAGGADSAVVGFINNVGQIVFRGTIAGTGVGSNNYGFWKDTPLGPRVVVRIGDVLEGLGSVTTLLSGGRTFGWNDAGQLAFPITISRGPGLGTFTDVMRIETEPATTLTSLARAGVADDPLGPDAAVIGGGHSFDGFVSDTSGASTVMNGGGEVAYQAVYSGPTGTGNRGIFVNAGGVNRIVASTDFDDDVLGPGLGGGVEFASFSAMHLNACGQVGVEASVTSSTISGSGLWAWTGAALRRIAFEGETFDVDPSEVEDLRVIRDVFVLNRGSGGNDGRPRALNDAGVVTFLLQFEDLTRGIFTAQLPLEGPAVRCISNIAPQAEAGANRAARQFSQVALSGEGSSDSDSGPEPLTFAWTQTGGPSVPLSDPASATPTFVPMLPAEYTFELVVSDGLTSSVADAVTIAVPTLGDLDLDEDVDADDLAVIESALGEPATGPNDLRDLNGDGAIDDLDASFLGTLCTRIACSVTDDISDLAVTMSVNDPSPNLGDIVTVVVTVVNNGPAAASHIQVAPLADAGLTDMGGLPSQGSYDMATRVWSVGALESGASATLTMRRLVQGTGGYTATASIAQSSPADPIAANNGASLTLAPLTEADVAVAVSVDTSTPSLGDTVTITVTVTNHGPATATAVSVDDSPSPLIPQHLGSSTGYQFVSAAPSQGTFGTGQWTVGTLAANASATLVLTYLVTADAVPATAQFVVRSAHDLNSVNDSGTVSVSPIARADLAITASVNNPEPDLFEVVVFTVTVTNNGPAAAAGIVVTETSASGYEDVEPAWSATRGSYASGVWTVGTLASGSSATLTRRMRVRLTGTYTKTFTASASSPSDPVAGNDAVSITPVPRKADLALTLTASDLTPEVGDIITFTLTVTNNGPTTATGVAIWEFRGNGYRDVNPAWSATQGSYVAPLGRWTVGTLANGASATLTRQMRVRPSGVYTKLFVVVESSPVDLNLLNNGAIVTPHPE